MFGAPFVVLFFDEAKIIDTDFDVNRKNYVVSVAVSCYKEE
jgi:hypothetical protein